MMNNICKKLKGASRIAAVFGIAALILMMVPFGMPDAYAADNTMETLTYDVTVDVHENNSYDYHEYLDMYYVTPHHGIYRYIPMQGYKISGIKVPEYDFETYVQNGYKVVKIGSGSYTLTGENPYDISYKITMYEDGNKEKDMLLLNLIPTDWETDIEESTCTVNLPKEADLSKVQVFSGPYGTEGNEDNAVLETSDDGKTITISSLYKSYIKKSTKELQAEVPWLVSVFTDNAGVIRFNDRFDLVYKAETHNSPSALDPYGGAMTGIVGVNRDPLGTGQGADLLLNVWGYCLGSPFTDPINVPEGLLHPRRLRDGVHKGVIDGGNQSGIPYAVGWEYFDDRYIGKPLVYCGTVGTLPRKVGDRNGWEKFIESGDYIVMTGGRIGKDGIHGATFSSEELHKDSPVQAVQIGDPITQKRMSDFIHEARERLLYRFVTDNGAGGLSSSVGEMADVCGGCDMDLAKAPLKYSGLQPWEILVSEAQERMSFAVAPERLDEFLALAAARDVEATVLGRFNHSGKFHITYGDRVVADIDIKFMHEGLPKLHLKAEWKPPVFDEPVISGRDLSADLVKLIGRLNICSDEYKARQYDHEVKGLSIIKPFTGVCRDVASDATVTLAEPLAKEGIVLSAGILPRYSDIDTYHMMASIIDLAVRRSVAAGADPDHIAGLDNFCWPDPVQSEKTPDGEYKLAQLVRANMALYDCTKAFKVPCISGKDSMKNDSTRGGRKISIPPTVLFSTIARIDDVSHAVSLDAKFAGDAVYVLGETKAELGGSEYYAMLDAVGNNVPKVDIPKASALYHALAEVIKADIPSSIISPALGGLAIAAAKSAIGGRLGMTIDLDKLPGIENLNDAEALFSESNSRFILTCRPERASELEKMLAGHVFARVGATTEKQELVFTRGGKVVASAKLADLITAYKSTLEGI